jgi:hypothetical protein
LLLLHCHGLRRPPPPTTTNRNTFVIGWRDAAKSREDARTDSHVRYSRGAVKKHVGGYTHAKRLISATTVPIRNNGPAERLD